MERHPGMVGESILFLAKEAFKTHHFFFFNSRPTKKKKSIFLICCWLQQVCIWIKLQLIQLRFLGEAVGNSTVVSLKWRENVSQKAVSCKDVNAFNAHWPRQRLMRSCTDTSEIPNNNHFCTRQCATGFYLVHCIRDAAFQIRFLLRERLSENRILTVSRLVLCILFPLLSISAIPQAFSCL